ncbi:MAG: PAS domain-containing protein, partial [Acidobacteriaceae bacterium]|nr:PAS domain-containing protein [Acidobacteriaceae bacterium]
DVHTLLQDRNGTLWASGTAWEAGPAQTGNTVVCAIAGGRTSCYGQDGSFGGYGVTGMYEDHRGNLWMAAANGLWRWAPGLSQHYAVPELNQRRTAGLTFSSRPFAESSGGSLLIASPDGLSEFADGKFRRFQLPPGAPLFGEAAVLRDRDGALWIGTADTGLLHLHLGKIDSFDESDGLSGNAVQNLFEDREGNVWIGTRNGLDRFREYTVPSISAKQGLSTSFVLSVLASRNGSIWMGTPNGLNRWNNGEVTIYRTGESARTHPQAGRQGLAVRELAAAGLPDNFVGSLYEDPQGRLWVSTARGIAYFQNGKFTPMPGVHIPSWSWSVSPVAQDASGTLWTTGDQGLYRISGGHVAEYLSPQKVGLRGLLSCFLAPDKIGGLWLGSWDGGVAYLKAGTPVASFGPAQGLGSGRVNVVKLDTENTLLAGTDGGLSRIKDGKVSTLTTKNGLPCDTIHALAEDTDHSLWLYTACGLLHISKSELSAWIADPMRHIQVSVFDASDGVKSHAGVLNFGPRMTRSPDGKLWFVPLAGVGVVDPHRLSPNKLPPPVHIEQITADRKTYDVIAGRKAALRLPPLVKDLTIDYTALSLVAPEKTHFRFKLDGQDRDWREAVNKREVQYSNLAPATYRFHVMACNNTGVWNQEGDTIEFSIAPAYYQTSWFRVASVATFGALLWGLYAWRVLRLQRQERQLREVVETVPAMAWIALPDGTCTFANKRWAEYTDFSPEETAGSGWISAIHKQDSESYLRHWRASLASGERFEDQARFRHGADGEYRWFLVRGVPMRDEHGNIVRWYGTMTDIEDRKRGEDQIKALNER